MMQLPNYYGSSAARTSRDRSQAPSMPPSLGMAKPRELQQGSNRPTREPFLTLDDCIQSADELVQRLRRLGALKHPLQVRKGMRPVIEKAVTKTVKAASRTYFFDVRSAQDGRPFLVITESRIKEKQRVQITIFPEAAQPFLQALQAVTAQL